ncbi:MAG: peptide ABC transporter substrate-binding protein [Lactococcus chungangensis]|jgi:ABC-type oligopeptide transport system, periplasmic component|uniref:ABC transporter n=2 Tax=Pseudolactococcus chungangensis TaxID=451457 RepID=A0A1K2HBM1_9LACT|nr:peptide ABC transporter substrate-binding protein [Lactococcus chungangensis]NCB81629.1 peptide ABC transporter substrate-binding protein [Bacilli bacterium]MDD3015272.1 peptide ABC transporter substrate-binding protein [Lactococcus chungangensis]NLH36296.1 peptide ABC transporter substrate-binding protein [Lactococcus chungangensis]PCS04820.1 ABC transporter [Lactococcus chungangensis CAU 28 = DSM 22330]SFZ73921.1 oligopeptide transport system substrate-binding protein [Lactococcus chungan
MTKKTKLMGIGLMSVAALGIFAACGNKSDSSESDGKDYSFYYLTDPETLDYTFSGQKYTAENTANFVDGLVSYDQYRQIVPALAKSWDVSEDGKTYTYHIRKNVPWVDADGNEYDTVKPSDWVTGLKHAADTNSETLYLVSDSITGLADYASGKDKDFSKVGIKADDKAGTLTYTLNAPESFWNSKATYGILYPINAEFLKEKGKDFGKVATDGILYNGAFIATKFDNKSAIEYKANDTYWDKKNVHIKNVKLSFFDGKKPEDLYQNYMAGKYNQAQLYPTMPYYKNVKKSDVIWTAQEATTYFGMFNLNRQTYKNTAHDTDAKKTATKQAVLNKDFRQAIGFAIDKAKYNAQRVGEEGGEKLVRNTLVPYDFVTIAGKDYGTAVQADLQAIDGDVWSKLSVDQGKNSTYNVDLAKASFAKAKEALKAQGIEVSKENPIILDAPVLDTSTINIAAAASMENSLEKAFDGEVKLNSIKLAMDPYLQAVFSFKTAAEADYDWNISGWGPDYADPATYLNILSPKQGDITIKIGLEPSVTLEGEDKGAAAKAAVDIDAYQKLLDEANAITNNTDARYEAFAKAEAWLIDNGIVTPIYSLGAVPMMQNEVPFTKIDSNTVGSTAYSYKYRKVSDKTVTAKEYEKALKEWKAKVEEKSKAATK